MKMATRTEVSSPHGVKRHGDDSLDSEQRLAKRFNLLNISMHSLIIKLQCDSNTYRRSRKQALHSRLHGPASKSSEIVPT